MVKKSAAGGHGSDEIDDLMILSRHPLCLISILPTCLPGVCKTRRCSKTCLVAVGLRVRTGSKPKHPNAPFTATMILTIGLKNYLYYFAGVPYSSCSLMGTKTTKPIPISKAPTLHVSPLV